MRASAASLDPTTLVVGQQQQPVAVEDVEPALELGTVTAEPQPVRARAVRLVGQRQLGLDGSGEGLGGPLPEVVVDVARSGSTPGRPGRERSPRCGRRAPRRRPRAASARCRGTAGRPRPPPTAWSRGTAVGTPRCRSPTWRRCAGRSRRRAAAGTPSGRTGSSSVPWSSTWRCRDAARGSSAARSSRPAARRRRGTWETARSAHLGPTSRSIAGWSRRVWWIRSRTDSGSTRRARPVSRRRARSAGARSRARPRAPLRRDRVAGEQRRVAERRDGPVVPVDPARPVGAVGGDVRESERQRERIGRAGVHGRSSGSDAPASVYGAKSSAGNGVAAPAGSSVARTAAPRRRAPRQARRRRGARGPRSPRAPRRPRRPARPPCTAPAASGGIRCANACRCEADRAPSGRERSAPSRQEHVRRARQARVRHRRHDALTIVRLVGSSTNSAIWFPCSVTLSPHTNGWGTVGGGLVVTSTASNDGG